MHVVLFAASTARVITVRPSLRHLRKRHYYLYWPHSKRHNAVITHKLLVAVIYHTKIKKKKKRCHVSAHEYCILFQGPLFCHRYCSRNNEVKNRFECQVTSETCHHPSRLRRYGGGAKRRSRCTHVEYWGSVSGLHHACNPLG